MERKDRQTASAAVHYANEEAVNTISIRATSLSRVLAIVTLLLVLASITGQLSKYLLGHDYLLGLVPLFDTDGEDNIPTFWSVLLLLVSCLLLAVVAALHRRQKRPFTLHWTVLSVGFLLMAYDEAFRVHETLIIPVGNMLGGTHLGLLYYAWVVPGIVLVFLLGLFFLNFMWHLDAKTRLRFAVAGTIYIAGAIVVEAIGGSYAEQKGMNNLTYNMITTLEESLERVPAPIAEQETCEACSSPQETALLHRWVIRSPRDTRQCP